MLFFFQAETWDGFAGQSYEEEKTDQTNAWELKKKKTWRKLPRPQTLLYLLGDLRPGRRTVHIITFVWIWTHRSGPLQEAEHGEWVEDDLASLTRPLQVLVTSLSLENIGYLEPANFWIGPSAVTSYV